MFEWEAIENLPEGWRAQVTLTIREENVFDEKFELAAPGERFERLFENHWSRGVNGALSGNWPISCDLQGRPVAG